MRANEVKAQHRLQEVVKRKESFCCPMIKHLGKEQAAILTHLQIPLRCITAYDDDVHNFLAIYTVFRHYLAVFNIVPIHAGHERSQNRGEALARGAP